MASYIQVAGKSDLLVGFPDDDYATLDILGEQMDDTQVSVAPIFHDVPGDSQGGPQGKPIEKQHLGYDVRGQFALSKWDPAVVRQIRQYALSREGRITDAEMGALMLRDRSIRIVVRPSKSNPIAVGQQDEGEDHFFWNFPCTLVTSPIETGQGTKFSVCRFSFEAFRVPAGHELISETTLVGEIWNKDDAGVATALGLS
jgi:hypothetical protein